MNLLYSSTGFSERNNVVQILKTIVHIYTNNVQIISGNKIRKSQMVVP